MKHFFSFILFLLFLPLMAKTQTSYISDICNDYFPFNPFGTGFSDLFKNLNGDTHSTAKTIQKRTDSTLFLFKSVYTGYSKLNFPTVRVETRLQEAEIVLSDSMHWKDTIIQYQVTCYCNGGTAGLQKVKKAFDRFNREYRDHFSNSTVSTMKNDSDDTGVIRNYFTSLSPIAPVSIAWTQIDNTESAFVILIRLKLKQNELDTYFFTDIKYMH
jgi:hypothetical protein